MEIKVLAIGEPAVVTKGKGSWNEITITYEGKKGETTRKIRSFAEADVYEAFNNAREGTFPLLADITVKKDGDFWVWKGATFGAYKEPVAASAGANGQFVGATPVKPTTKTAGTWETHEERAAKQRYIVRQSSITAALGYCGYFGTPPQSVEDVLAIAQKFEAFVFGEEAAKEPAKRGRPRKETATPEDDPIV